MNKPYLVCFATIQRVAGLPGFEALESQHIWTLAPGILISTLHIRVEVRQCIPCIHHLASPLLPLAPQQKTQDSTDEDTFLASVYQIMEHAVEHLTVQINKSRIGGTIAGGLVLEDEGGGAITSLKSLSSASSGMDESAASSGVVVLLDDDDDDDDGQGEFHTQEDV